jgi:dihydroneopterin aldolase
MDRVLITDLPMRGLIDLHDLEQEKPQESLLSILFDTALHHTGYHAGIADCVCCPVLAQKVQHHAETASRLTVEKAGAAQFLRSVGLNIPRTLEVLI